MGTYKQAETLKTLAAKVAALDRRKLSEEELDSIYFDALAADLPAVRKMFDHYNAVLGFDRKTAAGTAAQYAVIRRLERRLFGQQRTTMEAGMTFDEASVLIKELNAALDHRREKAS